ncbi:FecR domain-containing protein [Sphingobium sp. WCS2017Hpa-17]|uniref:FecR family protein n=1 Tax=Sphingobium sp. WCS2017Hpa-17 TaxID=3073638 RepID=UPI00288B2440|nr:FecR domain-containing protein [Sphingobium sp. WCS2017Hpa-17]
MTEQPAKITLEEREEAADWASLFMSDPGEVPDPKALDRLGRYQADFSAWAKANPARIPAYLGVVNDAKEFASDVDRVQRKLATQAAFRPHKANRPPLLLAASMVLCLMLAGGLWWQSTDMPTSLITTSQARTPLETRIGEVRTERLADGSSVILDTNTLLLVAINATERKVELKRGRARFLVAPETGRNFEALAAGTRIIARGGSFDLTHRTGVRINPIEGEILVQIPNPPSGQSREQSLQPGRILAYEAGQTPAIALLLAKASEQQWINGVKSFDNVPINDVIAEANSYSETKIVLATPALGQREIFADIDIRNIERVAQALATFLNLSIDRSQPNRLRLVKSS